MHSASFCMHGCMYHCRYNVAAPLARFCTHARLDPSIRALSLMHLFVRILTSISAHIGKVFGMSSADEEGAWLTGVTSVSKHLQG